VRWVGFADGRDGCGSGARATQTRTFHFPADHGPHPDFRNEWWYLTGNLQDTRGRRYGFQLTIFRIALSPQPVKRASAWGTRQVYMAHFALTDVAEGRFHAFERFSRGAAGLAGARLDPFRVWLGDWQILGEGNGFPWTVKARQGGVGISLRLTPHTPPVLQGEHGLSRKSDAPGNASYYYSIPRLKAEGRVERGGELVAVQGTAWLDREWSTSALGPNQAGWDWFALQLDDGTDLMYYRLRRRDGSEDPHSAGVVVGDRGDVLQRLGPEEVHLEVLDRWQSPSGGSYPSRWRLSIPGQGLVLTVRPVLAEQELRLAVRYWEGAVDVSGSRGRHSLTGRGYMELTGYAGRPGMSGAVSSR
jgi:predicted secreted hydrolase